MSAHLVQLRLTHLRNLCELELAPQAGVNLVTGDNGVGKTTVLEAIYLLGRGRSFREKRAGSLVTRGKETGGVFGRLDCGGRQFLIGAERRHGQTRLKMDGVVVRKVSQAARALPLILFTPESHQLLDAGPEIRRRFLDWCMFHVEPTHHELLTRFQRVLQQRNHALRTDPRSLPVWTESFTDLSARITAIRSALLTRVMGRLHHYLPLFRLPAITLDLKPGWSENRPLAELLQAGLATDLERGFTFYGPQRCDVAVRAMAKPADRILSRGQKKLLVFSLMLAAADIITAADQQDPASPIFLLDDPFSELDSTHRAQVSELLLQNPAQVFVTSIAPEPALLAGDALEHRITP